MTEAEIRETIARAIEAEAEFEGVRAQRVIRRCAYVARHVALTSDGE